MLEELHVAGLGVIREASLEFAPGLNVLTGETGAGKTMLTVALGLALGARGSTERIRAGEGGLSVEARFSVDDRPGSGALLDWAEDGEVVVARTVRSDGRSSARITGRLAPISALVSVGERLVEIHGQHQAERLLGAAAQMDFLDRFAGVGHLDTLEEYRATHAERRDARARLQALDALARDRERERDLLAYQVREIEAAGVQPGEMAALAQEESRLAHAGRILELTETAEGALGREGGATDGLRQAAVAVDGAAGFDERAAEIARRAGSLVAEAEDVLSELRAYRQVVDADPERLSAVADRLRSLRALERKYGPGEEGILAFLEAARRDLASLEGVDAERETVELRLAELDRQGVTLAVRVTEGRMAASGPLAEAVQAELRDLGMPGARFAVELDPVDEAGPDGAERVSFVIGATPGQPLLPLARVASGGELSRTMLACRSVLADLDDVPTLVFDEVDAGIGGRAATAVGERLSSLGRRRQVVVVTHLAQIASRADRHFVVTKEDGEARVRTVQGEDRSAELPRLLSGDVSDVSLAHARRLLATAGRGGR